MFLTHIRNKHFAFSVQGFPWSTETVKQPCKKYYGILIYVDPTQISPKHMTVFKTLFTLYSTIQITSGII